MDLIDVCAGAGGLSLGAQDAGFTVIGVEKDLIAAAWHENNVGPCVLADITTWSPDGPADVVAGGVPCQSFSEAGDRAGTDDPRGRLYLHLLRIAREAGARACLLENVPGLVTSKGGADFRTILKAFRESFPCVYYDVLDASTYGVPQKRKRLFVVGFREPTVFAWPLATHGPPSAVPGLLPFETVGSALGVTSSPGPRKDDRNNPHAGYSGMRILDSSKPSPTISGARSAQDYLAYGGEGAWSGAVRLTPKQCAILQDFPSGLPWPRNKTDVHRLIGNAVPRRLGAAVLRSIFTTLEKRSCAFSEDDVP